MSRTDLRSLLAPCAPAALLLVLTLLSIPAPAGAQAASDQVAERPATVESELAQLNRTLLRLVELMEEQVQTRRLGLGLDRIELENQRISDLEKELRSLESTRESLEGERLRLQAHRSNLAEDLETASSDTSLESLRDMERMLVQADAMLRSLEGRASDAERRIVEVEDELTRRRRDLRALQDRLDRKLQGM